jgi:hypothetical protein
MGATGSGDNPAQNMVPRDPSYQAIVLPFGLLQVWQNRHIFDPNAPEYNPVLAMEYAAAPIHFMFNRNEGDTSGPFVNALAKGVVSRDLNTYRGFLLAASIDGDGMLAPHWGGTIKGHTGHDGSFQGVYLGAGPYFAINTKLNTDERLAALLASTTPVYLPNATLAISNLTDNQFAGAITGGYRARFALKGSTSDNRDGVYVAANYNYLYGFRYDNYQIAVRLDTDSNGLITVLPNTSAITAVHTAATSGHGYAIDLGASVVSGGWEFGFGASGVANRINWSDFTQDTYTLSNLISGVSFKHTQGTPVVTTQEITLPVRSTGHVNYTTKQASIDAELSHGLQGTIFNGGVEYRMKALALRGGGRHVRTDWHATGGVGLSMSPRVALDVAAYGTSANLERHEKLALAVSIRVNAKPKQ